MSRRFLIPFIVLGLLTVSCNLVNRALTPQLPPEIEEVQTALPQIATLLPEITLQPETLGTLIPEMTGVPDMATIMPAIDSLFDPQGTPLEEWNGIPIMPQATAGYEESGSYAFKAGSDVQGVVDFYDEALNGLGWSSLFPAQVTGTGSLGIYTKGNQTLTITVTPTNTTGEVLVLFILA